MGTATIYTKTLTGGNHKGVILEPGMELLRETNLPDNWKGVRIGILGSLTNMVSSNGTPNVESFANNLLGPKFGFNIGLSNGVGYASETGNKFIGVGTDRFNPGYDGLYVRQASGLWGVGRSGFSDLTLSFATLVCDGTSSTNRSGTGLTNAMRCDDPTASSSCVFGLAFNVELSSIVDGQVLCGGAAIGNPPLSNAEDATLNGLVVGAAYASVGTDTSGWWTANNSTPVDCTFLSIRCPLLSNRLRIFNMVVQQTA